MLEPAVALGNSATTSALGTAREVNTAADLARLRAKGKTITALELKELTTRIKALEEMAKLEDRLRHLENQRRTSDVIASLEEIPVLGDLTPRPSTRRASTIRPLIKRSSSPKSLDATDHVIAGG